ncbi:MAG: hypothetical protein ABEJ40_11195 [Haloarculaceae archaeon]
MTVADPVRRRPEESNRTSSAVGDRQGRSVNALFANTLNAPFASAPTTRTGMNADAVDAAIAAGESL